MDDLLRDIRKCMLCAEKLAHGVNPVVQLNKHSKIVIIGQAPGKRVHETGIPWNDKSGATLRKWLDVPEAVFYNDKCFSILPMGFCYPGKGVSGDLPPRPECAQLWHSKVMQHFTNKPLVLLIGQYAQQYYLKSRRRPTLTETVRNFEEYLPEYFVLPHPSPRNQYWLTINPWFSEEVLPKLKERVQESLATNCLK